MRQVVSVSLPPTLTKEIKRQARKRGHASLSGYIQYLFSLDQDVISEEELLANIRHARKEYREGKTIRAKSIADLL